jgi:hypothetical protein
LQRGLVREWFRRRRCKRKPPLTRRVPTDRCPRNVRANRPRLQRRSNDPLLLGKRPVPATLNRRGSRRGATLLRCRIDRFFDARDVVTEHSTRVLHRSVFGGAACQTGALRLAGACIARGHWPDRATAAIGEDARIASTRGRASICYTSATMDAANPLCPSRASRSLSSTRAPTPGRF